MVASNDESTSGSRGYMTIGPSVSGHSTSGKTTTYENPCTDCTSIEELNTGIPGRVEVGPATCENDENEMEVDVTQDD
nr:unnamed protein product [Haemonchus contortus]